MDPTVHRLTHGVSELLVPFFLAGIGLHVDLSLFRQPSVILLCFPGSARSRDSKFAGLRAGGTEAGRADAVRIGVGMILAAKSEW